MRGVLLVPIGLGGGRLGEVPQQMNSRQAAQLKFFPSKRPWGKAQLCLDQIGLKRGKDGARQNLFRLCFSPGASPVSPPSLHVSAHTALTCSVPPLPLKLTSFLLFQPVKLLAASGPLQSVLPPSGTFCRLDSHGWCLIRCLSSNFTSLACFSLNELPYLTLSPASQHTGARWPRFKSQFCAS